MNGNTVPQGIRPINYGSVNCYLLRAEDGFVLIDTGLPSKRIELENEFERGGCHQGNLKLILLTHGDYDHAGNAAHFRERYGAKIAMHSEDSGRVERGDWKWNMKPKPDKFAPVFRVVSHFVRPGPFEKFKPDVCVDDGQSLLEYGLGARILHLPGHTRGSIGILTDGGELFCGDLMDNMRKPGLEFFIDDLAAAHASISKLNGQRVTTVYPGHGRPFTWKQFVDGNR